MLDPDDEGNVTVRNVKNHSPTNDVSHPRKTESSATPCENLKSHKKLSSGPYNDHPLEALKMYFFRGVFFSEIGVLTH